MLKRAILYEAQLRARIIEASDDPEFKYYPDGYWDYGFEIPKTNHNHQDLVSVDENENIHGFFRATINRHGHFVSNLSIIAFDKGFTFHKDFRDFVIKLFVDYKYNKVVFRVAVGSPNEKLYDKFSLKFNGRIVGTFFNDLTTEDGEKLNQKYYELSRESFVSTGKNYIKRYTNERKSKSKN
tara:strand:+ start:733 stop:1278 length:546 start_codon:yes stop_codon:yes gene_type:complete